MPAWLAALCYALAFGCFAVATVRGEGFRAEGGRRTFHLTAAGLALWVLVNLWAAVETAF
jgi:hypothetical protein